MKLISKLLGFTALFPPFPPYIYLNIQRLSRQPESVGLAQRETWFQQRFLISIRMLVTKPGGPQDPGESAMSEKKQRVGHLGLVVAVVLQDDGLWGRQVSLHGHR